MYIHRVRISRTLLMIYIRRGLRCCCLEQKAIPEPQEAEQQDCSPAFCLYMFEQNKTNIPENAESRIVKVEENRRRISKIR